MLRYKFTSQTAWVAHRSRSCEIIKRVVVVTGAVKGIGRAPAEAILALGDKVIGLDIDNLETRLNGTLKRKGIRLRNPGSKCSL